jgi:hypothetical protein
MEDRMPLRKSQKSADDKFNYEQGDVEFYDANGNPIDLNKYLSEKKTNPYREETKKMIDRKKKRSGK